MTITLYRIPDDKRTVDKTLNQSTNLGDLTAHFKEDTDILNPVLEIAYNASYTSANYCYISDWHRWYFITGVETGAQRLYLTCHVDVLYTYRSEIRNLNCIVGRQEYKNNTYMNDEVWRNLQARDVLTLPFRSSNGNETSFYRQCNFILTTGGEPR